MSELMKRNMVPQEDTWDLTILAKDEKDFEKRLAKFVKAAKAFAAKDLKGLKDPQVIAERIGEYESLLIDFFRISTYTSLEMSGDMTDPNAQKRSAMFGMKASAIMADLSAFDNALLGLSEATLKKVIKEDETLRYFVEEVLRQKKHRLSDETETAMKALGSVLNLPYQVYENAKLADMSFDSFKVGKQTYPLSFTLWENEYYVEKDPKVRHTAFQNFSSTLRKYHNTIATAYVTQVSREKVMANLRGYESVFDYLLDDQKIPREIYEQHIDTIMEHLSPVMRKWASHIKTVYGLKKMHYCDLLLPTDPEFSPKITIDEAKKTAKDALKVFGKEYVQIVSGMLDKRGIDWAQNIGKSTGGFYTMAYGTAHGFILLNWSGLLSEVFTLVHELGHAGHFGLANKYQRLLNTEPSRYFVEAPSTMNELILADYLSKKEGDERYKRFVVSSLVENTYYHNYVTHFLEAYFQREVYRLIDKGEGLNGATLDALMKDTLQKFWGEDVEIDDDAALTWMRQPHYYMGLYSYTYSAGLSLATKMNLRIREEGQKAAQDWLEALKVAGMKTPIELGEIAGVDIRKPDLLIETIGYIESLVDEVIRLTKNIK